ncbi:molybdopterin biosynthesis protein [Polyangium mundeleinium]|uniref:Molybdopterin molybdenumtransferase n=1 Tax=Polyangium mundeleinium TaxID=2995306 RepID=A0ABT5F602_9BACT|nr:molybdopterin biosynthesis protein [Polyangium mundeleinium]MDC0748833.1 molybdopterin biosynthesis protein [Polyangium mundeleinium]
MKQAQFLNVVDRDEAERRFRAAIGELGAIGVEIVPLDAALGRLLAEDVASPVDVPGFDRSNVDGYAVRASDTFGATEAEPQRLRRLPGSVAMGRLPDVTVEPGTALAIPTGGAVPRGADAIVMVEHTLLDGDDVQITKASIPGRWITYAGTDVAQGEVVLRAKERLTSRETGVLAAIGLDRVAVLARPRVAILSTGDEIVPPGQPLLPGAVYDSNARILSDAVREAGGEPFLAGIVPDDETSVRDALRRCLADAHVVLLSGGTSKGPGDLNARVLAEALDPPGIVVHGVALKPGKPLCLAVSRGKPVVVLPGFPTSAIFTFHEFVAPVIRALAGLSERADDTVTARLPFRVTSEHGRTEYVLVRLVDDEHGARVAYPIGKGSGSVTTFSQADGFFIVDERVEMLDAGDTVVIHPVAGSRPRQVDLVVIGSHCVGLDVLLGRLAARGTTSKLIAVGSEAGLAAVRRGECDVAGVHLYDPNTGTYNEPFLDPGLELARGYGRMQGVVFRPGDPRFEGKRAEDAVREAARTEGIVMINRNRGSGTRALYDRLLGDARPAGHSVEASSHRAVAAAVAQGRADFGIAIDIVARDRRLGFLPLGEERFDFVVPSNRLGRPAVRTFLAELASAPTRAALRDRGLLA